MVGCTKKKQKRLGKWGGWGKKKKDRDEGMYQAGCRDSCCLYPLTNQKAPASKSKSRGVFEVEKGHDMRPVRRQGRR